ncbi:MAG: acetyl-CoA carboxylase carboxyl transferase subunit beta, partial [Planctomycetaceae bacterium]|nr:acetyl-CoA carboxylase carboxyl transferase subunit beta [Planctomycetaceae bacterium]
MNLPTSAADKAPLPQDETSGPPKKRGVPEGLWLRCPACSATIFRKHLEKNFDMCPECEHHFYVSCRRRISQLLDEESFEEWFPGLMPTDPLGFNDKKPYSQR